MTLDAIAIFIVLSGYASSGETRKQREASGSVTEVPAGDLGDGCHAGNCGGLECGIEPFTEAVAGADGEGRFARGGSGWFHGADVQRVRHDGFGGAFQSAAHQGVRIAGQQRGEGNAGRNARGAERGNGLPAFFERGAVGFKDLADVVTVCGDGKTHARSRFEDQRNVTDDQSAARLDDESAGAAPRNGLENSGHQSRVSFGGLVRVSERGTVDDLARAKTAFQQLGGVSFEGGEFAPVFPVVRPQAALYAQGGDVAVAAAESAVAGGCKGVGESRFGKEAGDPTENRMGLGFKDTKWQITGSQE